MATSNVNQPVPIAGTVAVGSSNTAGAIFVSAARTHTGGVASDGIYASDEIQNPGAKGVRLFVVVANGSGTVVVKIQVKDPVTDTFIDLTGATTAALNNTAGAYLTVYPGLTGTADIATAAINQHLGSSWRAVATVAVATETFSVGGDYLL